MKNISMLFLLINMACAMASTAIASGGSLGFRLVKSKCNVSDILKPGINIDMEQCEAFANDNIIYIVSRKVEIDDSDLACGEMLGTTYSFDPDAVLEGKNYEIEIIFKNSAMNRLKNLFKYNASKGVAVIYKGRLLMAPIVRTPIASREIFVNGLTFEEASRFEDAAHKVCAWASNVSFRLVCPDNGIVHEGSRDKSDFEALALENRSYLVSKKEELGGGDYKHAKIRLIGLPPYKSKGVELDASSRRLYEQEKGTHHLPVFGVEITLSQDGQTKLEKLSENNIGRKLATVFEGRLLYVERIPGKTSSNFVMVSGLAFPQAKRLCDVINGKNIEP